MMTRAHYLLQELGNQLRSFKNAKNCLGQILILDEEGAQYWEDLSALLPECRGTVVACPETAKRQFLSSPIDLVILNHSPYFSCLELLSNFKLLRPSVSVIVTTNRGSEEFAVQVFRHGAIDYIKKPFDIGELESRIRAILEIRRWHKKRGKPRGGVGIQRALGYIEANFRDKLKLEQVAREAGMSISCFEKHLKKQTGMSFSPYVNVLRIAKAKKILQETPTSILEVALACGFSNQSHFNRVFKNVTGITPGECKKGGSSTQ